MTSIHGIWLGSWPHSPVLLARVRQPIAPGPHGAKLPHVSTQTAQAWGSRKGLGRTPPQCTAPAVAEARSAPGTLPVRLLL